MISKVNWTTHDHEFWKVDIVIDIDIDIDIDKIPKVSSKFQLDSFELTSQTQMHDFRGKRDNPGSRILEGRH